MDEPGRLLSRGASRAVYACARDEDGRATEVVKRFQHPRASRRWRDGIRARREYRILEHLVAAGVRVPRPLRLVGVGPAWDVHMEAVPDAVSLERLLAANRSPAGGWERLLGRLGRELARAQAARVHLRDMGTKNVLVDGAGTPWLVDFHDARIRRRELTPAEAWADVVSAAAAGRESLAPRLRLRFLASWRGASRFEPLQTLPALEESARSLRRERVARGLGRWTRESSRCVASSAKSAVVLSRRGRAAGEMVLELTPRAKEARALWSNAARLHEHRIPCARPGELRIEGAGARVTFDEPCRWGTVDELRALLRDRGLAVAGFDEALLENDVGGVALGPPYELRELDE